MKVAYLGIKGIPARGGADRVVEAIVTRMPALGVSPTVYCDQAHTPADAFFPGVELVRLRAASGKYTRSTTLALLATLHAVKHGRYDLIHLHNVEASFVLPLLRMRYPVVTTSHGAAYWRAKWGPTARLALRAMDYPFAKFSNKMTFVAAKDAKTFSEQYGDKIVHIPNGVGDEYNPDFTKAQKVLESHGLVRNGYFIFAAGRIEPTKGAHLAIQAVNALSESLPLLIVGDMSQVPEYTQRLRYMAGSHISFHPLIEDRETLFGVMASARFLVFPSLVEAMSMVLLEAASIGVPIICSDIPENRAVMRDDAVYFETENAASLADRLVWALKNPEVMQYNATRARKRIRAEYSWDTITSRYVQVYQDILGNSGK